jgi:SAM-dependent methyltransferase
MAPADVKSSTRFGQSRIRKRSSLNRGLPELVNSQQRGGIVPIRLMNLDKLEQYKAATHWALLGENYARYGTPLIPCEQDLAAYRRAIASWRQEYRRQRLRVLLCGVTPAIASMSWPDETDLLAVDRSTQVIRALWPRLAGRRWPLCGDWLQLPQADGSCDIVAGDGCLNCMDYPEGYRALAGSLHRILRVRGLFLMRCFTRPERPEEPAQVLTDLHACRIPSFHHFKWRLVMAMQANVTRGVFVNDVYDAWAAAGIHAKPLSEKTGWDEQTIETIKLFAGKRTHLSFPTLAEVQAVLAEYFDEISICHPEYPLGERCPILAFVRREK